MERGTDRIDWMDPEEAALWRVIEVLLLLSLPAVAVLGVLGLIVRSL